MVGARAFDSSFSALSSYFDNTQIRATTLDGSPVDFSGWQLLLANGP